MTRTRNHAFRTLGPGRRDPERLRRPLLPGRPQATDLRRSRRRPPLRVRRPLHLRRPGMPAVRRAAHRHDAHVPVPRLPVRHHHRRRDQRPGDRGAHVYEVQEVDGTSNPSLIKMGTAPPRAESTAVDALMTRVDGEHGTHAEGGHARARARAGADARVRVLLRRRLPRSHATSRAGGRRRPARGLRRSSTGCPAIRSMRARRRPAPMRCRRSTTARSTAPTSRHEPPVRRVGRQPGDRRRAGRDVQPHRGCTGPAGGPRHRRQASAAQGPQRHRGVLRGDRVDVRRLHRLDADRVDREPAQHAAGGARQRGSERSRSSPSSPGSSAWSCCARASGCSRATSSRCARSLR